MLTELQAAWSWRHLGGCGGGRHEESHHMCHAVHPGVCGTQKGEIVFSVVTTEHIDLENTTVVINYFRILNCTKKHIVAHVLASKCFMVSCVFHYGW